MKRVIDLYCKALGFCMVACLALMVVLVFGNVVLRYGFNSGFVTSEELSRWLFVWMTFLGAIVAIHERAHLGTDGLVARLPKHLQKLCLGLTYALTLYCCGLMLQGSWQQTRINLGATSAVMEVSMGWFYVSGVVFAISGFVIVAYQAWCLAIGRISDADLAGPRESEEVPR